MRRSVLCLLWLAWAAAGCAAEAPEPAADDQGAVCPADDPDCDRIDEPCVMEEAEESALPGSSPLGLGSPLTSTGKHRIWPKGRVPYKIGSSVGATTKSRLLSAMKEWQTKTAQRVRFEPATSSDTAYVLVSEGSPRVEFVGYKAGTVSKLYLRDPEYLTVTRHELGHVLGLEHEHRRKDRGSYIQVLSGNIVNTANCKYQFALCSDCAPLVKYNTKSVMHYRTYRDLSSCRVGGKAVLLTKAGGSIDHEWVLTTGDLDAIDELYGPPPTTGSGGSGGSGGTDAGSNDAGDAEANAGSGGSAGAAGAAGSAGAAGVAGSDGIDEEGWSDGGIGTASGGAGGSSSGQNTTLVPAEEGGCGCRAPRSSESHAGLGALLGVLGLVVRRIRSRW
ncbi:MAG: hypothetical protein AMXMBFR56_67660 [Polyangiaceae bacterium]